MIQRAVLEKQVPVLPGGDPRSTRCGERKNTPRLEQPIDLSQNLLGVSEMLDHVPKADDIETLICTLDRFGTIGRGEIPQTAGNAEFLADYPEMPASWTRAGVYFAWIGLTIIGVAGWVLVTRGYQLAGLLLLAVYAVLGLDSLGHYVLAPLSDHTVTMNSTILLEVVAAALVLIEVVKQMARQISQRGSAEDGA